MTKHLEWTRDLSKEVGSQRKSEKKEVQNEILAYEEEQGVPEEVHEEEGQEVATSGYCADVESSCCWVGSHRKTKIEEAVLGRGSLEWEVVLLSKKKVE